MRFPSAVVDCVLECVVGADHFVPWCGHDHGVARLSIDLATNDVFVPDVA